MVKAFGKHKQRSHHDKCHMVIPGFPFPHLVVDHTAFTFNIFKYPLHPITLTLHPPQTFQCRLLRGIGQRDFQILIFSNSPRNDQLPTMSHIQLAAPHINFDATAPNVKVSASAVAKRHRSSRSLRKRANNFTNFYAFLISLILHGRTCGGLHKVSPFVQ